ncbi:MAG: glucose 1-dehydrogenase [Alphaproteobacteria bacterium]
MMAKLDGKNALITGASRGIGAGVAKAFAAEGADVVINFPNESEQSNADAVVKDLVDAGCNAAAIEADIADEIQVNAMVEAALAHLGRIDILVNNAGIAPGMLIEDTPTEVLDRILAVNVRGPFLVTRRVLPLMYAQDYGKIINTASQHAYSGWPGLTAYTASKGAVISFTRSLALEVGARNINVNCVAPGGTRTPILADVPEELVEEVRLGIPKQRIAEVEDIVPAYVFLASDENRHFHGQCLSPNGGDVML